MNDDALLIEVRMMMICRLGCELSGSVDCSENDDLLIGVRMMMMIC